MDVLGELEKLRRQVSAPAPAPEAAKPANNGHELSRSFEMTLQRADLQRARRILVSFQVEDEQHQVVEALRDVPVDIQDVAHLEKLLLRLNIALHAKE